jgi:hypothetical protein
MYIIKGIVYPERATLSFSLPVIKIYHPTTNNEAEINLCITLNQITLYIITDDEWDILDLRNIARQFVMDHLAIIGFIKGYAYDVEIRQILNFEKEIDVVYGINIPCIEQRNEKKDISIELSKLMRYTGGELGMYIKRCLNDLIMSMKFPDDTGFYCYRAIESLKQYCKIMFTLEKEPDQWKKLSEITGYNQSDIKLIKDFAEPCRHGDTINITSDNRAKIFLQTWDIVDSFFNNINNFRNM